MKKENQNPLTVEYQGDRLPIPRISYKIWPLVNDFGSPKNLKLFHKFTFDNLVANNIFEIGKGSKRILKEDLEKVIEENEFNSSMIWDDSRLNEKSMRYFILSSTNEVESKKFDILGTFEILPGDNYFFQEDPRADFIQGIRKPWIEIFHFALNPKIIEDESLNAIVSYELLLLLKQFYSQSEQNKKNVHRDEDYPGPLKIIYNSFDEGIGNEYLEHIGEERRSFHPIPTQYYELKLENINIKENTFELLPILNFKPD